MHMYPLPNSADRKDQNSFEHFDHSTVHNHHADITYFDEIHKERDQDIAL